MRPHIQYLWYVLRHKWFVFVAGLSLRVGIVQLLTHDWSKFLPSEWFSYVAYFYGSKPTPDEIRIAHSMGIFPKGAEEIKADFDRAWNHHQNRQPHHWQYWLLVTDEPSNGNRAPVVLEMPERYAREMVADWLGAGRAINGRWDVAEWYAKSREHIILHTETRQLVERLIADNPIK